MSTEVKKISCPNGYTGGKDDEMKKRVFFYKDKAKAFIKAKKKEGIKAELTPVKWVRGSEAYYRYEVNYER